MKEQRKEKRGEGKEGKRDGRREGKTEREENRKEEGRGIQMENRRKKSEKNRTRLLKLQVLSFMRELHMADGDGVLAAVSGGADSVCLLFLLWLLKDELSIRLAAFHLHHGIRGEEADRDEAYVRELCSRLEVPFYSAHEDVSAYGKEHGISEEEAGRVLRYRHLEQLADELSFEKIATAHHREDQAETVLLNLFRGTGLKGLGGIRPVRGRIIRPLLGLSRAEIEDCLRENGICWCEDSTNGENAYQRNRIRNELLPWVQKNLNEQAAEHVVKLARLASEADDYFEKLAEELLRKARDAGMAPGCLPTEILDSQPEPVRSYLIRALIREVSGKMRDITERHVQAVLALDGPGGGCQTNLPGGLTAVRDYENVEVFPAKEEPYGNQQTAKMPGKPVSGDELERPVNLNGLTGQEEKQDTAGMTVEAGGWLFRFRVFSAEKAGEIPKNQYTKWFDYDKIKDTLSIRTRREGDFLELAGGGKKMLRRYFIDQKIPAGQREQILLLTAENHVLWVIGCRISEYYKVTKTTKRILEVSAGKGENHGG